MVEETYSVGNVKVKTEVIGMLMLQCITRGIWNPSPKLMQRLQLAKSTLKPKLLYSTHWIIDTHGLEMRILKWITSST